MTPLLLSAIAALAVWLAGRRDPARDPRLTTLALLLSAAAPLFPLVPKLVSLPAPPPVVSEGWIRCVGMLWLAGSMIALLRIATGMVTIARWRKRSTLLGVIPLTGHRRAELRILAGLRSPLASGLFRPVVLVPAEWRDWPESARTAVLTHELAHLARRDPQRRLLAAVACAVHWFNPLVHWMARRLESQCEFASDARVLATGHSPTDYARLLCDLAAGRRGPVGAVAMARGDGLERRIERILASQPQTGRRLLVALAVLTILTAAGLALLGPAARPGTRIAPAEVQLRLSADPFPGN